MLEIKQMFNDEITGWKRNVEFIYQNKTYNVLISWSEDYGYNFLWFKGNYNDESYSSDYDFYLEPEWVKNYVSIFNEDLKGSYALFYDLDDLTQKMSA